MATRKSHTNHKLMQISKFYSNFHGSVVENRGRQWLNDFMTFCPPSTNQGDFMPLHWYGLGVGGEFILLKI